MNAQLNAPRHVVIHNGDLYIPEVGNNIIRKIDSVGRISTFVGKQTSDPPCDSQDQDGKNITAVTFCRPFPISH